MRTLQFGVHLMKVMGLVGLLSGGLTFGLLTPVADASNQVTATQGVNVRSQPSLTAEVVGALYRGETLTAVSSSNGWTRVDFQGETAYVASDYLDSGAALPAAAKVGTGETKKTTTDVNLRKGPGSTYAIVKVVPEGTTVTLTGTTSKGYTEVTVSSSKGWISSQYLSDSDTGLPQVTGTRVTNSKAHLRETSNDKGKVVAYVAKGTSLSVTGATQNGWAQIVYLGEVAWVRATRLSNPDTNQPTPPGLPPITGVRYATADLNVRSTADDDYELITEVPKGTALSITGVVKNARMQIIWENAARWVTASYLSSTPPTSTGPSDPYAVEVGLKPNAIKVHRALLEDFPQIKTYYGKRKDALPDHPSGRALDIMLPTPYKSSSSQKLGKQIADYLRKNADDLGINYVIWNQHIWNELRDKDGWRYMADRGSDTANHKNHVHVTVLAKGYTPI